MESLRFIEPMLAKSARFLPKSGKWSLEVKWDGIRAIAIKNGSRTRLYSRRRNELNYPEIAWAVGCLPWQDLILDGEIVALDKQGRSSFQLLQNARRDPEARKRVVYSMFDILHCDGMDTTPWPLAQRRKLLQSLTPGGGPLKFAASLEGSFSRVWKLVRKLGLEGIVGKREDSPYEAGRRSGAWVKIKLRNEQEFVIGGYTPPEGSRDYFGAILVGYYARGKLRYAGRVGTGFNDASLKSLFSRFQKIRTTACPFANPPGDKKLYTWLKPRLVCQVAFAEWTHDENLRQPAFLGLREDKKPSDVFKET